MERWLIGWSTFRMSNIKGVDVELTAIYCRIGEAAQL